MVAASDPGFGNWMSTDGHRFGAIGLRWNQATEDVEPDVRVIASAARTSACGCADFCGFSGRIFPLYDGFLY